MNNLFLKCTLFGLALFAVQNTEAQNTDKSKDELSVYRVTPQKVHDLIHTKLDVSFDYGKRYLYGKEWLTLKPHFYETDSLTLDAKGMDFKEIAIIEGNKKTTLKYTYDNEQTFYCLKQKIQKH
ncbi:hypothetical protein ACQ9BO_11045 [Flavobacterium sp. P21]|uniref:hypothetical protein n=1 Tax=Flavobacterium sp. P21 TaxID=3423948 RepID=UPI003D66E056